MKKFICPRCYASQKLKHLYFLSMNSSWRCPECNILLKPKKLTARLTYLGILIISICAIIFLSFLKLSLLKAIIIAPIIGFFISLLSIYKTIILEEV